MNIFAVDNCPFRAAEDLPDKLVCKMSIEVSQILSTVLRLQYSGEEFDGLYRATHPNHPVTKWVMADDRNYSWLYHHGRHLCREYTKRYGRVHACEAVIDQCYRYGIKLKGAIAMICGYKCHTKFVQCMPEQYRQENSIQAYRDYMLNEKHYAAWNHGPKPLWWPR